MRQHVTKLYCGMIGVLMIFRNILLSKNTLRQVKNASHFLILLLIVAIVSQNQYTVAAGLEQTAE